MTQALDAAVRAAKEEWHRADSNLSSATRAALRAALPAEPPAELLEAMVSAWKQGYGLGYPDDRLYAAYRALRAHLLGTDV